MTPDPLDSAALWTYVYTFDATDSAAVLKRFLEVSQERGYTVEISPDGNEHKLIRPDGTMAIIARRTAQEPQ